MSIFGKHVKRHHASAEVFGDPEGGEGTMPAVEGEDGGVVTPPGEDLGVDAGGEGGGEGGEFTGEDGGADTGMAEDGDTGDTGEGDMGDVDEGVEDEAVDIDLDGVEDDAGEAEALEQSLNQHISAYIATEQFGATPAAMSIMQSQGLLAGTAMASIGMESFMHVKSGADPESHMAMEALGERIKDTAKSWAAKIVSVTKNVGGKLLDALGKLWTVVSGFSSRLASASWDKLKAGGRFVKAHPVATITTAIAAVVVVAGIIGYIGTGMPAAGAPASKFQSFASSIVAKVNGIKWPFGKAAAKLSENGRPQLLLSNGVASSSKALTVVKEAPAAKLGWGASAVKSVSGQLQRAWDEVKAAIGSFGSKAAKFGAGAADLAKSSGDHFLKVAEGTAKGHMSSGMDKIADKGLVHGLGASTIGIYAFYGYITACSILSYKLIRWIVVGTFRMVASAFRALAGALGVGKAEPAAA